MKKMLALICLAAATSALQLPASFRVQKGLRATAVEQEQPAGSLQNRPRLEASVVDVAADDVRVYPGDNKHGFKEGPSVAHWREYKAPASNGIENLRAAATKGIREAGGSAEALRYWGYHLARATFFAGQAAAGVIAYQATATASRYTGEDASLATEEPEEDAPKTPLGDLGLLVDTMGGLFVEAVETYNQDFGEVRKGTFRLPWDMVDGVRNRQSSPLFLADQGRRFLRESVAILTKRNRREASDFGVWLDKGGVEYPDYFLNNFHFQSDGWLSTDSAKVYETSTETLFLGRQDSMQRLSLYPLASWAAQRGAPPASLVEVACGTGRVNTFLRDNYPRADVRACDLSSFYLQEARDHARRWERFARRQNRGEVGTLRLAQANAEALPYEDESAEAVVCVYLFHELPAEARAAAAKEMARVVKPGGIVVFVDSIQSGDRPLLDPTLGNFQYLNEPHYPTYIAEDVGKLFVAAGLEAHEKHLSSTSKCLSFTKPVDMFTIKEVGGP